MKAKEFWFQRLQNYHKQMLKYSRYVLNDHLVMVAVFLLGFCAVQYASFIKQLTTVSTTAILFLAGILTATIFLGKLVTLIEEPDGYFLSMLVKEWKKYFIYSFIYSLWLPFILNGIIVVILSPLLIKTAVITSDKLVLVFIVLMMMKCLDLEKQLFSLETRKIKHIIMNIVQAIVTYIIILVSLFSDVRTSMVFMCMLMVLMLYLIYRWYQKERLFNWQIISNNEQARQDKWYRFIELFVDTNHRKKAKIHNSIVSKMFQQYLSIHKDSTENYLFSRTLTRIDSYSQFFVKYTCIIILFSFGISSAIVYFVFLAICLTIEAMYISTLIHYHDKHILMKVFNLSIPKTSLAIKSIIIRILLVEELICLTVIFKFHFEWIYLVYIIILNGYLLIFVSNIIFKRMNARKSKKSLTNLKNR